MDSSVELSLSVGSVSSCRCRTFKVLLLGDSGVGKTCLSHRLSSHGVPRSAEATIGVDFRDRTVEVDGEELKLQLWDTAGQERFRKSMVQHYYRNVHAVLFVYDITRPTSFNALNGWMDECRQQVLRHDIIPRFLVGNKSDLRSASHAHLQVKQDEGRSFARANNMLFFETSAMTVTTATTTTGGGGERGSGELQHDHVEDIVRALGRRLKRHGNAGNAGSTHGSAGGSFRLLPRTTAEKEGWSCC